MGLRLVVTRLAIGIAAMAGIIALSNGRSDALQLPPAGSGTASAPLSTYAIVPLPSSSLDQQGVISADGHYMVVGTPGGGWYEYENLAGTPTLLGRIGTSDYLNGVSDNGNAAGGVSQRSGTPPSALIFPRFAAGAFGQSPPPDPQQITDPAFTPPETFTWSFQAYNAHINSSDLVVGTSSCPPPANPSDGSSGPCGTPDDYNGNTTANGGIAPANHIFRAYQWQVGATTISPESFGGQPVHDGYEVSVLNNSGDFAGRYEPAPGPYDHYFVETVSGAISLSPLAFGASTIQSINGMNAGDGLAGTANTTVSVSPFFPTGQALAPWATGPGKPGSPALLPLPGPETDESGNPVVYDQGEAESISDAGTVVGYASSLTTSSTLYASTAMLWTADGKTTTDLNTLLADTSTYRIQAAWGIDSGGDIIASARNINDGSSTLVLLKPGAGPTITIADAQVQRPGPGKTAQLNFTISLSAASGLPVSVDYSTTDVTAVSPTDFAFTSGTLTFNPGETSKMVPVTVQGGEPDAKERSLLLGLMNPSGGSLATTPLSAIGTIKNGPGVTNVTLSIDHETPLWDVDLTATLINIVCPANVSITVGTLSTNTTACDSTGTPLGNAKAPLRVFDFGGNLAPLAPGGTPDVTASVSTADPSDATYQGTVTLPDAPVWIGVGDSFTSGHHQDQDQPSCFDEGPSCGVVLNDSAYSWVATAASDLNSNLHVPPEWAIQPVVVAASGSSASNFGSIVTPDPQIPALTLALAAHPTTWNVVSIGAGGNDAGLSDALLGFYEHQAPSETVSPWNVVNRADCLDSESFWSAAQGGAVRSSILGGLQAAVTAADAGGLPVRVVMLQYPHILPDANACAVDGGTAPLHGTTSAVDALDADIALVTGVDALVDLRPVFGSNPLPALQLTRFFGFPHPNSCGQSLMASAAVAALVSAAPPTNGCTGALPPVPPSCGSLGNCQGATSADSNGSAAATSMTGTGSITATAHGAGGITAGRYASNPVGAPTFQSSGSFFDVRVSSPNQLASVTIADCDLAGGTSVQWWSPAAAAGAGAWQPVSDQVFSSGPPPCVTITVGPSTSPSLADLSGTVFGVESIPAASPTATSTNTPVPPTSTNTATNTAVPPTDTPTPTRTATATSTTTSTNTPIPPTSTATATSIGVPPTDTPTPTKTAASTSTPTTTSTPVVPTATATATTTAVPATDTPTPTKTATSTSTPTIAPVPTSTNTPPPTSIPTSSPDGTPVATATSTPTSTSPVVPTATNTPNPNATSPAVTRTVAPTRTVAGTRTATATRTVHPTETEEAVVTRTPIVTPTAMATQTPKAQRCLTPRQKLDLFVDILNHLGAHGGQRRYRSGLDVNHDGAIDLKDIMTVLNTPTCRPHHRYGDDDG